MVKYIHKKAGAVSMDNLKELGFKGKRLEKLNKCGIATPYELLTKMPRKYMVLNHLTYLALSTEVRKASENKTPVVFCGIVKSVILDKLPSAKMTVIKMQLVNEENNTKLYISIYGKRHEFASYREYIDKKMYIGGMVQVKGYKDKEILCMNDPFLITENEQDLRIYPVYRNYKGISKEAYEKAICTAYNDLSEDYLPKCIEKKYNLCSLKETVRNIHFPQKECQISAAKNRIVFDDMLYFSSKTLQQDLSDDVSDVKPVQYKNTINFINHLPFKLTDDQKKAISYLREQMCRSQTSALVQGDVSCGKTIVAMALMLLFAENGYQSVLLAPTVMLARQHFNELSDYAEKLGYTVAFLGSDISSVEKRETIEQIKKGSHLLIVGTHSCFSDDVEYKNLSLVITDEEHKFGVLQKDKLKTKAQPGMHMVSMSATPIPRSIACSIYGNDVKIINIRQMPSGRKPVQTAISFSDKQILDFMEKQINAGHQAYVVCPLIDEAEEDNKLFGISSIEKVAKKYEEKFGSDNIGIITGKMDIETAEQTKKAFYENKIKILIATTVIEVGINIPNATLIVIESAERFGLATLHQLRGRVGRGSIQSYCILKKSNKEVQSRNLEIIAHTTDGFEVAREDLKNRGTGNVFGTAQSGKNDIINLIIDYPALYEKVSKIAQALSVTERKNYIESYERSYPSNVC